MKSFSKTLKINRFRRSFYIPTAAKAKLNNLLKSRGVMDSKEEVSMSGSQFYDLLEKDSELKEAFVESLNDDRKLISRLNIPKRATPDKKPVKVALTGAAGAIGYAALFRIAAGDMLGTNQPIDLHLLDLPGQEKALEGVKMELNDCAFPLLNSIKTTTDVEQAFDGVSYALLVGAKPRGPGMERGDLLKDNGAIFKTQGQALNKVADRDNLKVVVVGNPANTNAWIASQFAPDISPTQFTAMTQLDHNRGLSQIASKLNVPVEIIKRFAIWGNHSKKQYPDISHTLIGDQWAKDLIKPKTWIKDEFIPKVQDRGAEIIKARGASSAASAASAAIEHMNFWVNGTYGNWTSMAVWSDGSYGAEKGVYYSFPVTCLNGNYTIVQNVPIDKDSAKLMQISNEELIEERDTVAKALNIKQENWTSTYNKWKTQFEKDGKLPGSWPPSLL